MSFRQLLKVIFRKQIVQKEQCKKIKEFIPYVPKEQTPKERFEQFILYADSCWLWQGSLDSYGYGKFKLGTKTLKAHRYSYELYKNAFDSKFHVLHKCDVPACVNPDHLFLGTNRDHVADRKAKMRN